MSEDAVQGEAPEPEGFAERLARFPGPGYRKAYLADLLASGNRFRAAGNARGAEYCYAKVAEALAACGGVPSTSASDSMASQAESDAASPPGSSPDSRPQAKPPAPRSQPKEKPLTPTERFRRQWRLERIRDSENVLAKHAGRLSLLEHQSYRDRLEKLRQSGQAAMTSLQSDKADAALLELRRRLYQRVLKSQRLALSRRRMPVTLARLALPPIQPGVRSAAAAAPVAPAVPALPVKAGKKLPVVKARVDTEWQSATGPYNDRYNMEDLLGLVADADAAWVQEFLDLYRGLAGLQGLATGLGSVKK
ncbi:MAG: hypothetical protein ABI036_20915 [Fibrobacteria bacterium]